MIYDLAYCNIVYKCIMLSSKTHNGATVRVLVIKMHTGF